MRIAIDGPAGAGKGTLARRLARRYDLPYLDTGLLYRAVAAAAIAGNIDTDDEDALAALVAHIDVTTLDAGNLRTQAIGNVASEVARHAAVRRELLELQRHFANQPGGAILDGRDIGTVICPDAAVKLYVTASAQERAQRRARELEERGERVDIEKLAADIAERDHRDATRATAPLRPAEDAVLLDTTDLSIDAAFEQACQIIDRVREKAGR